MMDSRATISVWDAVEFSHQSEELVRFVKVVANVLGIESSISWKEPFYKFIPKISPNNKKAVSSRVKEDNDRK